MRFALRSITKTLRKSAVFIQNQYTAQKAGIHESNSLMHFSKADSICTFSGNCVRLFSRRRAFAKIMKGKGDAVPSGELPILYGYYAMLSNSNGNFIWLFSMQSMKWIKSI